MTVAWKLRNRSQATFSCYTIHTLNLQARWERSVVHFIQTSYCSSLDYKVILHIALVSFHSGYIAFPLPQTHSFHSLYSFSNYFDNQSWLVNRKVTFDHILWMSNRQAFELAIPHQEGFSLGVCTNNFFTLQCYLLNVLLISPVYRTQKSCYFFHSTNHLRYHII